MIFNESKIILFIQIFFIKKIIPFIFNQDDLLHLCNKKKLRLGVLITITILFSDLINSTILK